MIRFASFDIVFQEVPGEVTLALNLTGCPNRCKGCHSPHLWEDSCGEPLTPQSLVQLYDRYRGAVTCICFMGGDATPQELLQAAHHIKKYSKGEVKLAWYSGKSQLPYPAADYLKVYDYIKLGPYIESLGGLISPTTNQRFYQITDTGEMQDSTAMFRKKQAQ